MKKLTIGYFYPHLLNLYGDNGNVEILVYRALKRGFDVEVTEINPETNVNMEFTKDINLVFMGGGPDALQKLMYRDLLDNKGSYLRDYIENGGIGLYVCGSYQLLGDCYKFSDGTKFDGLGIYNIYTQHFGKSKPRSVGNLICKIMPKLLNDPLFQSLNNVGDTLVGFENHGGRTYFMDTVSTPKTRGLNPANDALAKVLVGYGNNGEDGYEGLIYNNSINTYLHGPLLSKNPHIADWLIAKALNVDLLEPMDDTLAISAHKSALKLKQ